MFLTVRFFKIIHWEMIKELILKPIYHYSEVHKHIPMICWSQFSGKHQTGGKYDMLVSIVMLLILGVSNLVWGRLCCHRYQPWVECFPWRTQWSELHVWPQVSFQVILDGSSDLLVYLVPSLLLECTALNNWIKLSMLLRSVLILTDRTHHFLIFLSWI